MDVLDDPLVQVALKLSEVQLILDTLAVSTEQNVVFISNCGERRQLQSRLVRSKHALAVQTFSKLCTALHRDGHEPKLLGTSR